MTPEWARAEPGREEAVDSEGREERRRTRVKEGGRKEGTRMKRTPVKKEKKWSVSSGRDTDTSRVGQVVPSDRSKAGEQN